MKKALLFLIFLLGIALQSWAYDFEAIAPSGQTLYYNIVDGKAEVTYQTNTTSSPRYTNLTGSLTIPSSATYNGTTYSVTSIGDYAFYYCRGLTSVTIPNSVTSIGGNAFYRCSGLTSVTIPNSVTSIGGSAFYYCSGLTSVTIPNSVTSIGGNAFFECYGLTSVTIGNSVTSIGNLAFGDCSGLTSVYYTGNVAGWCGITFGSYTANPLHYAHNLYINGSLVTDLVIPSGVTEIKDYAFKEATCLTSVTIPNSVTSIGECAFYGCSGLPSVTIPNSVTSIGGFAFSGCSGLTSVYYTGNVAGWCGITFGSEDANPLWYAHNLYINGSLVTDLVIPSGVTEIKDYTFDGATCLTSVTIGNSVTSIGRYAFYGCSGLTSVTIGNSVTSIGGSRYQDGAFYGCSGLTSVYYTGNVAGWCGITFGWTTDNPLYYAHNLYINGSLVTDLVIPSGVTEIKDYTFVSATCLTSVTIGNSVTSIGERAFYGCSGLTSVTIGNSVTSIGDYAFYGCSGLCNLDVPTSVISIGSYAFNYVNNVSYNGIASGSPWGAFFNGYVDGYLTYRDATKTYLVGCCKLAEGAITIPSTVDTIGDYAFDGCSGLTSVTIGNSVTSIGNYAFEGCTGLTEINSHNNVAPTLGDNAFYGVTNTIPVYIPCGSSASYYSRWSYFSNFVEGGSFTFSAISSDNQMGTVQTLTAPTCTNPQAVVYAVANSGYQFDHWSDGSTANPYSLNVTDDLTLTAYFSLAGSQPTTYYTITVVASDPSMGSVTGGGSYASGTTATLTASANSGYHFTRWQDNVTSNPRTITVTGNATYTAYFESDGGGEQPSDNAPSIACVGVDMNGHNVVRWEPRQGVAVVRYNIYREGLGGYSQVGYVNATNATEYSWVDDNSNTATQAYSYKISEVSANGTESDLSLPHTTMHLQISQGQGSTWNLSWTPYVGFNYSGYRIYRGTSSASMSLLTELSSSATTYSDNNAPSGNVYYQIEVVASGAKSITVSSRSNIATSVQNQQFTIDVLSDNSSMGTVSGGGTFAEGATATISATPLSGYTFTQWSDGSTQAQRTITVTGNATYTAYFAAGGSEPQQYLITVVSNNPDRGTVTGGGLYDAGSVITITAEPFAGFEFVKWQDGNTEDFRTITVTADATYTAYFRTATEGIDDVEATDNIKIYSRGNTIVIDFSRQQVADSRQNVVVYDIMGRVVKQAAGGGQQAAVEIAVTSAGVYMVKVGDAQPQKVVVRR